MATPMDPDRMAEERRLIARSVKQDGDAFGQLVARYADHIFNLAYRMVGNRTDAEDVAQETFIAAFKALPSFRADAKFSTWLYRIAANKCTDWLRVRQAKTAPSEREEEALDRAVESSTPERLLSQRQVAEHLERAIERLPPLYREAFVLKHVEGLSYAEMREILGVSTDTLKMRVYKGRLQLSRELTEWNDAQDAAWTSKKS
jgi:RNA polymerase sigma-70 factor (ECF subfamily)